MRSNGIAKIGQMIFLLMVLSFADASKALTYSCQVGFGELIPLKAEVEGQSFFWNAADQIQTHHPVRRRVLKRNGETVGFIETVYVDELNHSHLELVFPDGEGEVRAASQVVKWQGPFQDARLTAESERLAEFTVGSRDRQRLILRVMKAKVPVLKDLKMDFSGSGEVLVKDRPNTFVLEVAADQNLLIGSLQFRLEALEVKLKCSKQN